MALLYFNQVFFLLPSSCTNQCVSSRVNRFSEMANSLVQCNNRDLTQRWTIRSIGSYVKVESFRNRGKCIGIDYEKGDSRKMLREACENGILMMKDCDTEYGTEWYFTGGQLVSSVCWSSGVSTYMTAKFEGRKKEECEPALSVWGGEGDVLLRADTFMFTSSLPLSPFQRYDDDPIDDFVPPIDDELPWIDDYLLPTISPTLAPTLAPTLSPTFSPTDDRNPNLEPTLSPTLVSLIPFSVTLAPL